MKNIDIILNEKNKKLTWVNKNYFYLGTVFLIANISLSFFFLDSVFDTVSIRFPRLGSFLLSSFRHADFYHLLGNMFSFLFIGLILERQFGTLHFVCMFFAFNAAANFTRGGVGASGTNYCFYGFIYLLVIFNIKHFLQSGKQCILNWVCLAFITLIMFWSGNRGSANSLADFLSFFKFNEHIDLWDNFAHLNGFVIGIMIGLVYNFLPQIKRSGVEL